MQTIALQALHAHPHNANVMPEPLLKKLTEHIKRTNQYPPIIVRPISLDTTQTELITPAYQILDGHHRVTALSRLGYEAVDCMVWEVDEAQGLTFVATLNQLHGEDDPRKRGQLVHELTQHLDWKTLVHRLPEDQPKLKKLLELHRQPPRINAPQPIGEMPMAVHFFLLPDQRNALESHLREMGGTREEALMRLVHQT